MMLHMCLHVSMNLFVTTTIITISKHVTDATIEETVGVEEEPENRMFRQERTVTCALTIFTGVEPNWTASLAPLVIRAFADQSGPTFHINETTHPAKVFSHLFPDDLMEMIVDETNSYASKHMDPAKYEKWDKLTLAELKAYFGFNILMGLVHMPEIEDYWKKDAHFHYSPIASCISRDRFRDISRYLHFTSNELLVRRGQPGYDKFGKVCPIIDAIKC